MKMCLTTVDQIFKEWGISEDNMNFDDIHNAMIEAFNKGAIIASMDSVVLHEAFVNT